MIIQGVRWSDRVRELTLRSDDAAILSVVGGTVIAASTYYQASDDRRTLYGILREADLELATLSETLFDYGSPAARDVFLGPSAVTDDLKAAGIGVVNLATSHLLDAGAGGLQQTLAALQRAGIAAFGGGTSLDAASRPLVRTVKGRRIAFLGFRCTDDWRPPLGSTAAGPQSAGVSPIRLQTVRTGFSASDVQTLALANDLERLSQSIRQARRGSDALVLCLDVDWRPFPTAAAAAVPPGLRQIAHAAVDAGADLVFGSGAHQIKAAERYKHGTIFYDLGNFAFELFEHGAPAARYADFPETQARIRSYLGHPQFFEGLLVRVVLASAGVSRLEVLPFALSDEGRPHVVDDGRAGEMLQAFQTASAPLGVRMERDAWHGWIVPGGNA